MIPHPETAEEADHNDDFESQLGNILNNALVEIYFFDAESLKFLKVSNGALKNLGYSAAEIRNFTPLHLKKKFTAEEFEQNILGPLRRGERDMVEFDTTHRRKSGSSYNVLVNLQKARFQGREAFMALVLDITERKKAEEKLIQSNIELERFAYIASHDLQEPMRMIFNFTELLEQEYGQYLEGPARQYMNFIQGGASRMHSLVTDLLEYSRAGRGDIELRRVNCEEKLQIVLRDFTEIVRETGAKVTADEMPVLYTNPMYFVRLVQNLLGNALKYTRRGVPPVIHIGVEEKYTEWLFCVRDNGIGIPEEYLEEVFVVFKRLHKRSDYDGSGIGLSICKRIVESFNGRIWVKSRPGEGSAFYFTIPKYTGEME